MNRCLLRAFFIVAICGMHSLAGQAHAAPPLASGTKAATDFRDFGRAPRSLPVRIALTLAYSHQAALDALVAAQSDPASPLYHRYLTNAEFNAYYAPTSAAYASVRSALQNAGFRVVQTFDNRTVIDAVGPVSAAERFFATEIHWGVESGHGVRYTNVREAARPPALGNLVVAVSGLDDLISFSTRHELDARTARSDAIGGPLHSPHGGYGPLAYAAGYDEPVQHGYDGSGRAIANTMSGNILDRDLNRYLKVFHIKSKHPLIRIAVDGGNLSNYDVETTLDVEAMTSTTPGAQIYQYSFAQFIDVDAEDTYNRVVDDNLVDAANSSWGGCEGRPNRPLGTGFSLASNAIFEQGAAKGITFSIATGDDGSLACRIGPQRSMTSADSDPYALAVGGTTLRVGPHGIWRSETAWHLSTGGVSVLFPVPSYQVGIPNIVSTGRNIPDIALNANVKVVGLSGLWTGHWVVAGGTSISSPMWVGMEAQIDQYLGSRIGWLNPRFYQLSQSASYPQVFHDIVKGNNRQYHALPGYDQVTGIGSPIGWALAQANP